jgi:sn-glycerol 3-phosphate transport system permease protein
MPPDTWSGSRHEQAWRITVDRHTTFDGWLLPALLVLPQLLLTIFFFLWPAAEALWSSLTTTDPFGQGSIFVGLDNFTDLFSDPLYLQTILRTAVFCAVVSALAMSVALLLAVFADREIKGRAIYRTLLIWPYAVAPAMAAVLWLFLLHPQFGLLGRWLNAHGIAWDYVVNGGQAFTLVALASAWKQVSYDFIFFLAGLQSIPRAVTEAARMDGARGWHRFRTITFPLLAPTTFFLLVVNLVYAAFDTFGTIWALTQGGPGKDTETLVIKVYRDGMVNQDIGGSAAQSVVLMVGVIALTALQFRFLGRRKEV